MDGTGIEWTDATWNPIRGCSRVSEGCRNCYAERLAARFSGWIAVKGSKIGAEAALPFHRLAKMTPSGPRWTGQIDFVEHLLEAPLSWRRSRRVFVNSMSDLFHENVRIAWLDRLFAVMMIAGIQRWRCSGKHGDCEAANCATVRAAPEQAYGPHTFQILTKRPERMLAYLTAEDLWCRVEEQVELMGYGDCMDAIDDVLVGRAGAAWLKNVWLGVSVEDQGTADARIPLLLQAPAAVKWISAEPLLGPVDLRRAGLWSDMNGQVVATPPGRAGLDWVVVGGESGPGARPFCIDWADAIMGDCRAASVPVFVKQLGRHPVSENANLWDFPDALCVYSSRRPPFVRAAGAMPAAACEFVLRDKKGGDMSEWPVHLRVREFPRANLPAPAGA